MKAGLLIASARRLARSTALLSAASSIGNGSVSVASSVHRSATLSTRQTGASPSVATLAIRAFSTTNKPPAPPGDEENDDEEDVDDDDEEEEGDAEDDEDEEDEDEDEGTDADFLAYQAAHRATFNQEDLSRFDEDPNKNYWDEERWGKLNSEDWQGFEGDLDAVTEEGVPKWLQSVRDLSAIHHENSMRAKLARRAMEEAKKNILRVRKVDALGRAYGTGRRKTSTARVWIKPSPTPFDGRIKINKMDLVDYFVRDTHREEILKPFVVVDKIGHFDVFATVKGGGMTGQAGAMRHGISRALQHFDPALRPALKKEKLLTRDPRGVERKKAGQKKARKKFQWVKR